MVVSDRASNFELLRIIAMLMVLNVHSFVAPNDLHILTIGGGLIDFFRVASSISCVNLFVLISGYFGISWKVKSIFSLIFQVYFWIFLIYIACLLLGRITFSLHELMIHGMGIMTEYWFIPTYIGLYIMAPLINAFVEKSSKRQLLFYIIIFYVFFTVDALPFSTHYSNNGYSIYSFMGLYLIGRYIKIWKIESCKLFSSKIRILIWIGICTMLIVIATLFTSSLLHKGGIDLITFPLSPLAYNNPLVIIQSILIFLFFAKLKFYNKSINWCAASALAIYLLHMHLNLKQEYYGLTQDLYSQTLPVQYLSLMLLFIAVALIAIPLDKTREWIYNKGWNRIELIFQRKA